MHATRRLHVSSQIARDRTLSLSARRSARGFTLVELVVVIVVLGILSVGTVRFIRDAGDGYASSARRAELGSNARLAVERLSRDLRTALPNSVRVSGACVEYIPIVAAATYQAIPVALSATSFKASPLTTVGSLSSVRVAVHPDDPSALYGLSTPGAISPLATFSVPDASNLITVSLAASHRFAPESAQKRFFVVATPVSYCVASARLFRYQNYGFTAVQPTVATLPTGLPQRAVVADAMVAGAAPFTYTGASENRNAVVKVSFAFGTGGDALNVDHLVQLRNVP